VKILLKIFIVIFIFTNSLKAIYEKEKFDNNYLLTDIIIIRDDNLSSSALIIQDALGFGYPVNTVYPDSVTLDLLNLHRLVILSTGNNSGACTNSEMRVPLQTFIETGGKAIIEGGDNAYISFVLYQFPAFRTKVLKTSGFVTHNGGTIVVASEHTSTKLFTSPNFLPSNIGINFTQNSDMDVCTNIKFSEGFYKTSLFTDKAGIIVAPSVTDPQIINFCFSYAAVENRSDAKNLLNNSVYNLIGSPISVTNTSTEVPDGFFLNQNFPNPFNPITNINYQIPQNAFVNLKVYDTQSKIVTTLINEKQNPGSYKVDFDGSNLPSGVYYYHIMIDTDKITSEDYHATKRMILLK